MPGSLTVMYSDDYLPKWKLAMTTRCFMFDQQYTKVSHSLIHAVDRTGQELMRT